MATRLSTSVMEGSTLVVTCDFTDEDGNDEIPTAIVWNLVDEDGETVNSRSDVAVSPPAASVDIVLSGDDLPAGGKENAKLYMDVEATYDSDLGSGLKIRGQIEIPVEGILP